jgi:hypothetical protein
MNYEARILNEMRYGLCFFDHSSLVLHSSFVIRHSDFVIAPDMPPSSHS